MTPTVLCMPLGYRAAPGRLTRLAARPHRRLVLDRRRLHDLALRGLQAGGAQLARINQLDDKLKETGGKLGEIVQYQAYPEAYADLANGRLDYVVNSVVNLSVLIKERPGVFKLGTAVASRGFVAWPVAKGNDSVLQFLTEFRNHLKETGKLEELQNKWLGMTFPDLPDVPITSLEQFRELTK